MKKFLIIIMVFAALYSVHKIWQSDFVQEAVNPSVYWQKKISSLEMRSQMIGSMIQSVQMDIEKLNITARINLAQKFNFYTDYGMAPDKAMAQAQAERQAEIEASIKHMNSLLKMFEHTQDELSIANRELSKHNK